MCASYESRFNFSQLKINFTLPDRQLPEVRPTMVAPFIRWIEGARRLAKGHFGIWQAWMERKRLSTHNAKMRNRRGFETLCVATSIAPRAGTGRGLP